MVERVVESPNNSTTRSIRNLLGICAFASLRSVRPFHTRNAMTIPALCSPLRAAWLAMLALALVFSGTRSATAQDL